MELLISILHTCLDVLGIFNNCMLMYLAVFKSPRVIRVYSVLIFAHAITDLGTCLTDLFNQPRLIPCDFTIALISNGLCRYMGPSVCFVVHSIQLHFLTHSLYLILLSFSYRLYVLHRTAPRIKTLLFIIFIFYLPSAFQTIVLLMSSKSDSMVIKQLVLNRFPSYELTGVMLNGYEDLTQFAPMLAILHATCPTVPVYMMILVLRRRIMKTLERKKQFMGPETREMHSQLLKALSIQALLPGIICLSILCFVLGQMRVLNHPVIEYLTFLIVLIVPSCSPLISFVYIRPFRESILKAIHPKRRQVMPKTSGNSI